MVSRRGTPLPDLALRGLRRIDAARLTGALVLVSSTRSAPRPESPRASLAAAWDVEVAALPPDWSDVYAELELRSTEHFEQGALLAAPINPARVDERPVFRFRCAREFGYGAAPGMVRRCLERLDERRHPRRGAHPARALRHEAVGDAGAGLVRGRSVRLMPDPVAWLVVEPGWEVVSSDGEKVGVVREVLGDKNADIFDGLAVDPGLLKKAKYVPAERSGPIVEGSVTLELTKAEFDALDDHEERLDRGARRARARAPRRRSSRARSAGRCRRRRASRR